MRCFIVRWQLSAELDHGERRPAVARHLEQCESCRTVASRMYALHDRLSAAAPTAPRIAPVRAPIVWPALAAAAVACALIATLALSRTSPSEVAESQLLPAPASIATGPSASQRLVASLGHLAAEADPLRAELTALGRDARRGASVTLRIAGLRSN